MRIGGPVFARTHSGQTVLYITADRDIEHGDMNSRLKVFLEQCDKTEIYKPDHNGIRFTWRQLDQKQMFRDC